MCGSYAGKDPQHMASMDGLLIRHARTTHDPMDKSNISFHYPPHPSYDFSSAFLGTGDKEAHLKYTPTLDIYTLSLSEP